MKKDYPRLKEPENYILSEQDIANTGDFDALLNHLTDVVVSEPSYKIDITEAGVSKQKAMVSIATLENPRIYTSLLCDITTGIEVKENRGLHMSRCIESIFTLSQKKFSTLDDFTLALATMVKKRQESDTAFAEVTGTYFHKRYTRKTKLASYDNIELISKTRVSENKMRQQTGMKVYNATSCPCTKVYTKYSIVPGLRSIGQSIPQIRQILDLTIAGSHMQLGPTIIMVDKENTDICHTHLYEVLDQSLHLVYELLKRPDEHEFVKRVLDRPQFTEDATREVAYNAYQAFHTKLSPQAELLVKSVLKDSIHTHDVRSVIHKTFGEIQKDLQR